MCLRGSEMSKSIDPDRIKDDKDVERYARQMGWPTENGGRHKKVIAPSGICVYSCHGKGEFPTGTRHAIIKQLKALAEAASHLPKGIHALLLLALAGAVVGYFIA